MLTTILFFALCYHILWATFSIGVHRQHMHTYWKLNPVLDHLFRFILWLTWGALNFKNAIPNLVAQHRKHHAQSDQWNDIDNYDPVSPHVFSLRKLLDFSKIRPGTQYWINPKDISIWGKGATSYDDWIENNIYVKYPTSGLTILWIIATFLFGWPGFIIGGLYKFSIKKVVAFHAACLHVVGYRTQKAKLSSDRSLNTFPLSLVTAGEGLHGNHHDNCRPSNFSFHWWELDLGYWYAVGLSKLKLLKFI